MDNGNQKKRKTNFTDKEIRTLIEIYAKFNNTMTNKHKLAAWKSITGAINDLGDGGIRTMEECTKKWKGPTIQSQKRCFGSQKPSDRRRPCTKNLSIQRYHYSYFWRGFPHFHRVEWD
ncbi:hypothetical protein OYC64_011090 [Pagothenia borchgrevinki]|uniref:Myb-like domain-containing protein n=1 Tax=Pagothenia borchgrevinki TaxID=8213 RepID=A0ABD2H0U5_PAGBO